jgi:hypothetical protein
MSVQVSSWNFSVSALDGLQYGIMYEDVLVLGLDHVVSLRSKARHMTIDIDSFVLSDALQHGINNNVGSRAADASTTIIFHENNLKTCALQ